MSSNGNEAGSHNGRVNGVPSPALQLAAQRAVERAAKRVDELAKHEAGSEYGRICRPLLLGPQRYRNPEVWGPDYSLRGAAPGTENTPEQIAEMKKVPLTEDHRYQELSHTLDRLDAELGLPGTPD